MRLNDEYKRILIIIVATSVVVSALVMMREKKDKELFSIPDYILDVKELGPSKISLFIDKNLSIQEKYNLMNNSPLSNELLIDFKYKIVQGKTIIRHKKD